MLLAWRCYCGGGDKTMATLDAVRQANAGISLLGKEAVVVGGTSGIGRAIAERLAQAGCSVTIIGRSKKRGASIVNTMRNSGAAAAGANPPVAASGEGESKAGVGVVARPSISSSPSYAFMPCDCFSLKQVNECVAKLQQGHPAIDFLVVSQGMATLQGFTPVSETGLDQKLSLHVYSRHAFVRGLLPQLKAAESGRVLSVLSAGVHSSWRGWETDPELSRGGYSIANAADTAGFYNDIFLDSLADRETDVSFMHQTPGVVNTRWGTEFPAPLRFMTRCLMPIFATNPKKYAEFTFAALTDPARTTGLHLLDAKGQAGAKLTALHAAAKDKIFQHLNAILDSGKAVAEPKK